MPRQFMQIVDGPLSVRDEPHTGAQRLGELSIGAIIEIVPGVYESAEGFDWLQHQFGWSVARSTEEGAVFMQPVPEAVAASDPAAVLLTPMPTGHQALDQAPHLYFQVVDGPLIVRALPRISAVRVAELPNGLIVAVDASTRTLADGFIWWRHAQGWTAASTDAGTEVYMQPVAAPPADDPMQLEPEPPATDQIAAAVQLPDLILAHAAAHFFRVILGPVTVRERPDVLSRKIGEIPDGVTLEVVAGSRTVSGDYVYWQHSGGWSAEGRVDGTQQFMIAVENPALPVELPAPTYPTITPDDFRFLKVVNGPVNIRTRPDPASEWVGEIPNNMVIEVEKGTRTVSGGYIYYRHSRGWSALGAASGGSPFMIPIDVMMPDVIVTLPKISSGIFQVVNGPISIRTTPDITAEKVGELLNLTTIEIDRNSETARGGYIWWRHHLGWSAERRADNSQVFMVSAPVMLNPPLPPVGAWDDGTPYRYFEVIEGPVSIRKAPDAGAERIGTLFNHEQIEVDPATRMMLKNFIWWKHAQGWSAERQIAGTRPFMRPLRALTQPPATGGFSPYPIFERYPLALTDVQWIQYFGSTRFAYNLRLQRKFWYDYSQGLHGGFDFGCNRALPVFAGVTGKIIDVQYGTHFYAPNFTRVRVGPFMVIYGHLAGPRPFAAGDEIGPETILGVIDAGGQNHVHLEVRYKNQIVNPLLLMSRDMQGQIIDRWKNVNKHFYRDSIWNQWLTPLDQPLLTLQQKGREVIIGPHAAEPA